MTASLGPSLILAHADSMLTSFAIRQEPQHGIAIGTETYSRLTELLRIGHAYPAILDLSLKILSQSTRADEITQVLDTFLRFTDIWASMDSLDVIGEMLYATHKRAASNFQDSRLILVVLLRPEFLTHLSQESRQDIESEVEQRKVTRYASHPLCIPDLNSLVGFTDKRCSPVHPRHPRPPAFGGTRRTRRTRPNFNTSVWG